MLIRTPKSRFTLSNFCRASLYATLATLKAGMDILANENVLVRRLTDHGGLFRHAGAKFLAAAVNAPVSTMETAAVGGPYGMALLAAYAMEKAGGELFGRLSDEPRLRRNEDRCDPAGSGGRGRVQRLSQSV